MEPMLKIAATEDCPEILFDRSGNVFSISGRSLPEDAVKFYEPIKNWLREYVKEPNSQTEFVVDLEYFNSASTKQIMEFLVMLEDIPQVGKDVKIVWRYAIDDELMQDKGEEIRDLLRIPLELEAY